MARRDGRWAPQGPDGERSETETAVRGLKRDDSRRRNVPRPATKTLGGAGWSRIELVSVSGVKVTSVHGPQSRSCMQKPPRVKLGEVVEDSRPRTLSWRGRPASLVTLCTEWSVEEGPRVRSQGGWGGTPGGPRGLFPLRRLTAPLPQGPLPATGGGGRSNDPRYLPRGLWGRVLGPKEESRLGPGLPVGLPGPDTNQGRLNTPGSDSSLNKRAVETLGETVKTSVNSRR